MAKQQLEQVNHRKDLFLIRAAHELRTPLTTILGEAQRVRRSQGKAERAGTPVLLERMHMETIEARAQELRALLETLIDLSRVRAENTPLQPGLCDFGVICREVVEKQRTISGRALAFVSSPEPMMLHADYARISQVVLNLVKYAIEYAQENTMITISLRREASEAVLSIHYAAPTMDQESPGHSSPYTEAMFGEEWGLGLTLSQEIVERYGGHIEVEASGSTGVTCAVHLPF